MVLKNSLNILKPVMSDTLKYSLGLDIRIEQLDCQCDCGAVVFTLDKFDPCLYHFSKKVPAFSGLLCILPDHISSQNPEEWISGCLHITVMKITDTQEMLVESRCSIPLDVTSGGEHEMPLSMQSPIFLCGAKFESCTKHSMGIGTRQGFVKGSVNLYSFPRMPDSRHTPIRAHTEFSSIEVEEKGSGELEVLELKPIRKSPVNSKAGAGRLFHPSAPPSVTASIEEVEGSCPPYCASPTAGRHSVTDITKKKPLRHFIAVDVNENGEDVQVQAEYRPGHGQQIRRSSESPRRDPRPAWSISRSMSTDSLSVNYHGYSHGHTLRSSQVSQSADVASSARADASGRHYDSDLVVADGVAGTRAGRVSGGDWEVGPSPSNASPTATKRRLQADGAMPPRVSGGGASRRYSHGNRPRKSEQQQDPPLPGHTRKLHMPQKTNSRTTTTAAPRQAGREMAKFSLSSPATSAAVASRIITPQQVESTPGPAAPDSPLRARARLRVGMKAVTAALHPTVASGKGGSRRVTRKPALPLAARPSSAAGKREKVADRIGTKNTGSDDVGKDSSSDMPKTLKPDTTPASSPVTNMHTSDKNSSKIDSLRSHSDTSEATEDRREEVDNTRENRTAGSNRGTVMEDDCGSLYFEH